MACLVCRGAGVDVDALTCTACRDFAEDRQLHAGFEAPASWGRTAQHYVATMAWLDAAAQRYGIPPPEKLEDAAGPWAHFVIAVHAINSGKHAHAAAEAMYVVTAPEVPGFPGMKEEAVRIRAVATDALAAKGIAPVRTFKALLRVNLPDIPAQADFSKPEWQHYQAAVEHVRKHDYKAALREVTKGLKINGFDNNEAPVTWYLKRLGASIKRATKPQHPYRPEYVPVLPEEVQAMLDHYDVKVTGTDLHDAVWVIVARAFVALDHQSWSTCYRRIEEARRAQTVPSTREQVEAILVGLEARIPVKRDAKKINMPEAPEVRPTRRLFIRSDKNRSRWR